ncbi:hypothetical protein [Campylobacter gastrosuis]|uniref:Uncharacterized protein n=1 Tax=Campylobacter gastrosuis TaxID=2974576 RepID=A0ABT7HSH2_9BACT|nr:hypothetical protein [Campylobacter gastrosuis]MDL0089879.1 hypothetical protein [Campylobacter gastrosuis]
MTENKESTELINAEYMQKFKEILALSVNENSPYKESLKFLNEKLDEYAIPDIQKVQVLAQLLPNMTITFTNTAMQTALSLLETSRRARLLDIQSYQVVLAFGKDMDIKDKELAIKDEQLAELSEQRPQKLQALIKQNLAIDANIKGINEQTEGQKIQNAMATEQRPQKLEQLKQQVLLLKAQIEKTKTETTLAENQKNAVRDQVFDNRVIKSLQVIGSFISEIQANGLNVPADMTKFLFNLTNELIKKNGLNLTLPSTYNMTKPK